MVALATSQMNLSFAYKADNYLRNCQFVKMSLLYGKKKLFHHFCFCSIIQILNPVTGDWLAL